MIREVTAIVRHDDCHATLFGTDWNARIIGDRVKLTRLEAQVPGVLVDLLVDPKTLRVLDDEV